MSTILVGTAQLNIAKNPDRLETRALGSCVGIALYDPVSKIGGLAHAMLPSVECAVESSRGNPAKFVDTSIDALISLMVTNGAKRIYLQAKLAGGANMFPEITKDELLQIGRRNARAARDKLTELKISVQAEDIGGAVGRTIILDTENGRLTVRTISKGEREI